jgi:N-acetylglutamate synthase-like GNAT family acetyltransferase
MLTEEYSISSDPQKLDLEVIHGYLTRSYWAQGISKEIVQKAIEGSLCFGVYHFDKQVGFARVVTDHATFAYLCDVFVLEEHRGKGLSKKLMEAIMKHPSLQGLRRFMLVTKDAHGLYEPFGFQRPPIPDRYMEIHRPDVYRQIEAHLNGYKTHLE